MSHVNLECNNVIVKGSKLYEFNNDMVKGLKFSHDQNPSSLTGQSYPNLIMTWLNG